MINRLLIQLTEADKRIIFVILAILVLVLVLIALIGFLVVRVMKYQGKKINNHITAPVVTGVITNEGDFKKYARKKNLWLFYHQARIPALISVIATVFYVVASLFTGFKNPFSYENGFATLLFVWDFSKIITTPETGAGLLINWPTVLNSPHVVAEAWVSYVFIPIVSVGVIWYLITVQAFIARGLQINKLGRKIYSEQLEHFVAGQGYQQPTEQTTQTTENK